MRIIEQSNSLEESEQSPTIPTATVRRATGPRTAQGKEKSKHNALKHGIFSQSVLMKGESRAGFDSLLSGLQNHLEPVGTLEELLVDKLSVLIWRQRRLIANEANQPRTLVEQLERENDLLLDKTLPLDQLLRYEASLERAFDRTLNQLERLQRMRKGQPVPPPLSVNVTT